MTYLSAEVDKLIDLFGMVQRAEARCKDIKTPRSMPKSYQKSKQFRTQTTLKKK